MSPFLRRFLETAVCGILLLLITLPSTKTLWAQGTVLMMGRTSGGLNKILQTDSSGNIGTSGISVTATVQGGLSVIAATNTGFSIIPATGATFTMANTQFSVPGITTPISITGAMSAVTTANTTGVLLAANTSRKAFCFANIGASYSAVVSTNSPVTATNGYTMVPVGSTGANSYCRSQQVPTGIWYVIGVSGAATTVVVEEDS